MIPNVPPAPELPGLRAIYSGKVRDLYEYPDGRLLFVASDRMSAYDWVLPTTIPDKGRILTTTTNIGGTNNQPSITSSRAMTY